MNGVEVTAQRHEALSGAGALPERVLHLAYGAVRTLLLLPMRHC